MIFYYEDYLDTLNIYNKDQAKPSKKFLVNKRKLQLKQSKLAKRLKLYAISQNCLVLNINEEPEES